MLDISNLSKLDKARIFEVGVRNPNLRTFDISLTTDRGTTYNSYLLLGNKNVLIDGVRADFAEEQISNIKKVIDPRKIDYILLNHTEPDHAGSIASILDIAPNAKILSSRCANIFIKEIIHREFKWEEATEGFSIDLGWDSLSMISAPLLHWPDTIMSYLKKSKILFSCDAFGAHYCPDDMLNTSPSQIRSYMLYYADNIIRPFKSKVRSALGKLDNMEISGIAPSHGPIHSNTKEIIDLYTEWSKKPSVGDSVRILIAYCSTYGYTEKMAEMIKTKLTSLGATVVIKEIIEENIHDIRTELELSQGLLIGTPTIAGDAPDPAWRICSLFHTVEKGIKLASVFGSFGWSGEACELIKHRLEGLKVPTIQHLKVRFLPNQDSTEKIEAFAEGFYNTLADKTPKTATQHSA